jgi:hypothetical protein
VAVVSNAGNITFYVNGAPAGTDTGDPGDSGPSSGFSEIGNDQGGGGTAPFLGSMDDMRYYNRALSAAEVRQLYNLGR